MHRLALLLNWMLRRRGTRTVDGRAVAIEAPRAWMPLATFAVFALGLVGIGLVAFSVQRDQLRASAEARLHAVAELRVDQINNWLRGVRTTALHFGRGSQIADHFAAWTAGGGRDRDSEAQMLRRMAEIRAAYGYANITLFDRDGAPRLSERPEQHMQRHGEDARIAMARNTPVLVDYHHHDPASNEPMLGMVAPLVVGGDKAPRSVGALFFSIPANTSVIPLISRWPGTSPSGETVLGQRHPRGIVLLYASRQDKTPAAHLGALVESASARWLLANARDGVPRRIPDAVDYHGVPVLAYGAAVPDTDWLLVAKQDGAEIDAQVDGLARVTALVTALLLAAAGLATWLWWRAQANRQRAQLLSKELERQVLAKRFETLSRYASDVILLTDGSGFILEANERVHGLYGYTREELIGQHFTLLLPPGAQEDLHRRRAETLATGQLLFEAEHQAKDGHRFPVEVSAHVIELHGVRHGHLSIRDISERHAAAEQLRMQAMVLDQIQDQVTITDLEGRITFVNDALCRKTGHPRSRLLGQHISVFGDDPGAEASQADIAQATLRDGHWRGRITNTTADGGSLAIELRTTLIRDAHAEPVCMVGVGSDITNHLRAEQALRESEALYRGVIETAADGFWITNGEGRILEVNDAYCARSGYSRAELLGMRISDLEAQEDAQAVARHIETLRRIGHDRFETRHRARDGTPWQAEINASYSPLQGGRFFVFVRDIGKRNLSESLLRTRLHLSDLAFTSSLDELMQVALDRAELYTSSQIGFFHFVDPDQETLSLQAWSSNTLKKMCTAEGKGQHYPVSHAGVWADAVRERRVLVHNDYASLPDRKGMPAGHAPVVRELVVPILREDKVVAVLGVGNKTSDYSAEDVSVAEQLASMVMDMVARKRAEDELKQSNLRLTEAQRIALLGNWDYDLVSGHIAWSEQIYAIMGLDPATEPPGFDAQHLLFHPDDFGRIERATAAAAREGTPYQLEARALRPDGEVRHTWISGQAARNANGQVVRLFGTMQDITDRRQAEARLEHATHYDTLTDLPNRHWLFERLQHALKSRDASPLALLVLNIDRFAQLNESLGRALGDQALVALARRWAGALPEGCALARLDADQFAVLDEHHDVSENVLATATSLMEATRQPLRLGSADNPVELTLSIGIALYPNDADEPSRLLHAAEDALRNAKADKGNKVRFYDRQHAQAAITRFETEAALRQALARDEFFLVYQPQADAASGRVNGVEALLRWRRGDQVVPPGRFIGVVESTDLAEPVSRWVLQSACRQARQWLDRQHPLRVAVNIFSDHVTSGHLLDDVRRALRDSGLPPALLELEVVESSLLSNPEIAALTLRELKRLGVGLALDDFGTGYSSLGYLKHYPFDVLKIDQIFARNVTRDPEDAAIVRSTIALAHNLGMRVLAEGVETEPQLRFMARYGCDLIQGYLLGRPTTPQEVELQVMGRRDLRPHGAAQAHETPGVLILEGDAGEAETLIAQLAGDGFRPYAAGDLDAALDILGRERIDLILCGDHLGDTSGVEALERLRHLFPDVPRVMCSARAEQAVTVDALNRAGIRAWLARPAPPETLLATVRGILADNNGRA